MGTTSGWERALERAEQTAASCLDQPVDREADRVWTAVCGVLAVAFAALGGNTRAGVDAVRLGPLLWHVQQGPAHVRDLAVALVGADLAAGTDSDPAAVERVGEPLMMRWLWLTRTWPAAAHGDRPAAGTTVGRDGVGRVFGRERPAPALEFGIPWAVAAAGMALARQRGGIELQSRIRIIGGEEHGWPGTVVSPVWDLDDDARDVWPGPPPAYLVSVTADGERVRRYETVLVFAEDVQVLPAAGERTAFGTDRSFTTVWEACLAWAEALVDWHRMRNPGDWHADDAADGARLPLVAGLVAVALFETSRARGLHVPADGSAVSRTPLLPAVELVPGLHGTRRLAELVGAVTLSEVDSDVLDQLRWFAREDRAVSWVASTAHSVLAENAHQSCVPVGATSKDLFARLHGGEFQVTLADRVDDLLDCVQGRSVLSWLGARSR